MKKLAILSLLLFTGSQQCIDRSWLTLAFFPAFVSVVSAYWTYVCYDHRKSCIENVKNSNKLTEDEKKAKIKYFLTTRPSYHPGAHFDKKK